jgi:glycosyltransferase involved in cell wall biosynthesis
MLNHKTPLVSVILTSYNHSKYIAEAIESVLLQDFQDFELLIIDDNSTDGSENLIKKYHDQRIKFIKNNTNLGQCGSTNLGISLAQGKYIAHLCSDDRFSDFSKLQKQVDFLENPKNSSFGAVFTLANPTTESGEKLSDRNNFHYYIFDRAFNRTREKWLSYFFNEFNCLCFPSVLVKKECYDLVGKFDPRYTVMLDLDMWIRVALKYDLFVIQEKLVDFRVGESSNSSKDNAMIVAGFECEKAMNNFLKIDDLELICKIFGVSNRSLDGFDYRDKKIQICNFLVLKHALEIDTDPHRRFFLNSFFDRLGDPKFAELLKMMNLNEVFFHKNRDIFLDTLFRAKEIIYKEGRPLKISEIPHFKKFFIKRSRTYKILRPLQAIKRHYLKREILKYEKKS